jgi:hypothetical protein
VGFEEIPTDSRCLAGSVCIWLGQVQRLLEIRYSGKIELIMITQTGLSDAPVS